MILWRVASHWFHPNKICTNQEWYAGQNKQCELPAINKCNYDCCKKSAHRNSKQSQPTACSLEKEKTTVNSLLQKSWPACDKDTAIKFLNWHTIATEREKENKKTHVRFVFGMTDKLSQFCKLINVGLNIKIDIDPLCGLYFFIALLYNKQLNYWT